MMLSIPPPPSSTRRDVAWSVLAAALVIAITAAGIVLGAHDGEPPGAKEWDPRVSDLVLFVETERGQHFRHPVEVEFLTADEYRAHAIGSGSRTADDKRYFDEQARLMRALGLLAGDVDLGAEQDEISDSATLAFYSPDDKTVYVRGTELTPSLRVTLVHELTHALQDQTWGISPDRAATDGEAFALRAIAEGDAIAVENQYYDLLSRSEQQQVDADEERDATSSKALTNTKAPVLLALFGSPYDLGVPFVQLLIATGDRDKAFAQPPRSEENVLDPVSYFAADQPLDVPLPNSPRGARRITSQGSTVGAVTWYTMIATYTDQKEALRATIGWGGDAMRVYEIGGRMCAALRYRGDTATDAEEMQTALAKVTAALPHNDPVLSRTGSQVDLTVCDPGPSTTIPQVEFATLFAGPALRTTLIGRTVVQDHIDVDVAACGTDKAMATLDDAGIAEILHAGSLDDPPVTSLLSELDRDVRSC